MLYPSSDNQSTKIRCFKKKNSRFIDFHCDGLWTVLRQVTIVVDSQLSLYESSSTARHPLISKTVISTIFQLPTSFLLDPSRSLATTLNFLFQTYGSDHSESGFSFTTALAPHCNTYAKLLLCNPSYFYCATFRFPLTHDAEFLSYHSWLSFFGGFRKVVFSFLLFSCKIPSDLMSYYRYSVRWSWPLTGWNARLVYFFSSLHGFNFSPWLRP